MARPFTWASRLRRAFIGLAPAVAIFTAAPAEAYLKHVALAFVGCSDAQMETVREAVTLAHTALAATLHELGNGWQGDSAAIRGPVASALSRWFGTGTDPAAVLSLYRRMLDRMHHDKPPITMECDIHDSAFGRTVLEDTTAWMGLGRPFFDAAPAGGFDTRMGTFIHELSHLVPLVATEDIVYGTPAARDLAINDPYSALRNADNIEYLIEGLVDDNHISPR